MSPVTDDWCRLGDQLDDPPYHLIPYYGMVLRQKLWSLFQPLKEANESSVTEVEVVKEWRMMFLPRELDLVSLAIEFDLLYELVVH